MLQVILSSLLRTVRHVRLERPAARLSLMTTQSITAAMSGKLGTVHEHLASASLRGVPSGSGRINVGHEIYIGRLI
jgi:hypothetical protein